MMKMEKVFLSNCSEQICEVLLEKAFSKLIDLSFEYPDFKCWYESTVIPEFYTYKREIILIKDEENIAGMAILKKSDERKISTLRVCSEYQHKGVGKLLFESSFDYLGTEKPIITVSEKRIFEFKRILDYYNFVFEKKYSNYYRQGTKEFVFNGLLNEDYSTFQRDKNLMSCAK